jgi:hypothetical protein
MRLKMTVSVCLCLCFAATLLARQDKSDSVSGVWFGYYGTNPRDQAQVRLTLQWDGKVLTGSVTTGDDPFDLENTKYDPKTGAIHLEVVVPNGRVDYHYVIDGKVDKDSLEGVWHHEFAKGDFKLKKIG